MENPAHRHKLCAFLVNVLLVDFISDDHDVLFVANADDGLKVVTRHDLACRVAWVDYHDAAWRVSIVPAALDASLQIIEVQTPILVLIQVVRHQLAVVKSEESRVERILGDRDQDSVVGVPDQGSEAKSDGLGRAIRQVDIIHVRVRYSISAVDEVADFLADVGPPLGVSSVGARRRLALIR